MKPAGVVPGFHLCLFLSECHTDLPAILGQFKEVEVLFEGDLQGRAVF